MCNDMHGTRLNPVLYSQYSALKLCSTMHQGAFAENSCG